VTAIIDGMGSIGAAIGPLLTGYIAEAGGFDGVFLMLYTAAIAAGLLLIRLCIKEVRVALGCGVGVEGGGIIGAVGRGAALTLKPTKKHDPQLTGANHRPNKPPITNASAASAQDGRALQGSLAGAIWGAAGIEQGLVVEDWYRRL